MAPAQHDPDVLNDDEQSGPSAAQLDAAQLELTAAVDQLLQPETVQLQREGYDPDVDGAEHDFDGQDRAEIVRLDKVANDLLAEAQRIGPTVKDGETEEERDAARARVANLIDQIRRARGRQEGLRSAIHARGARYGLVPPLIERLLDAVAASSNTGGAPSAGATRTIIGLQAAHLVNDIDLTTRWGRTTGDPARDDVIRATPVRLVDGQVGYEVRPVRDLPRQLRRWVARAPWWRATHPQYLLDAAALATWWAEHARAVLNPGRPLSLAGACPRCDTRTVLVDSDLGERVQRHALDVDPRSGITRCLACPAIWRIGEFEHLARVLEQDRLEHAAQRRAKAMLRARGIEGDDNDLAVITGWLLTGYATPTDDGQVDSDTARTA